MNLEKLFNLFVSHDDFRNDIQTPFKQGNYYFATDAHSMIYIECDKAKLDYEERLKPNALHIVESDLHEPIKVDINLICSFITDKHKEMNEIIEELKTCKDCRGSGEVEWEYNHYTKEDECPVCEGCRQSMQEVETDKIIVDHSTIYEVFDSKFNYTLLDRLVNSCRMIGEPCYKIRGVERQSFHFKCGDFTIVLMPMMSQDADYHITL